MKDTKITVLAHGGAGSKNEYSDGTETAARKAIAEFQSGATLMEAVCQGVAVLEDDSRFNAGVGSQTRNDGSVQMDAAVMDNEGRFGAVAVLEGYRNPIYVAKAVTLSKYRLLAGRGAAEFAERHEFKKVRPEELRSGKGEDFSSKDTVGSVAYDGKTFVAALSTGGIRNSFAGRVGDVPLIGCGLYAGPHGAVAATGDGEAILMNMTAIRAYQLVEQEVPPQIVLEKILGGFDNKNTVGLILVTPKGFAGGANRTMAWSASQLF